MELVWLIAEFIFYLVMEAGTNEGYRYFNKDAYRYGNPTILFLIYVVVGYLLGYGSTLLYSNHIVSDVRIRTINLVLSPIILGLILRWRGQQIDKRGGQPTPLDTFLFGFSFAFSFALARYLIAN